MFWGRASSSIRPNAHITGLAFLLGPVCYRMLAQNPDQGMPLQLTKSPGFHSSTLANDKRRAVPTVHDLEEAPASFYATKAR